MLVDGDVSRLQQWIESMPAGRHVVSSWRDGRWLLVDTAFDDGEMLAKLTWAAFGSVSLPSGELMFVPEFVCDLFDWYGSETLYVAESEVWAPLSDPDVVFDAAAVAVARAQVMLFVDASAGVRDRLGSPCGVLAVWGAAVVAAEGAGLVVDERFASLFVQLWVRGVDLLVLAATAVKLASDPSQV